MGASISYYYDECIVGLKEYDYEIPKDKKEEMAHIAELHGWAANWK